MSAAERAPSAEGQAKSEDAKATSIRELAMRARMLPLEAQMAECVDLLQSPGLLVAELEESLERIREVDSSEIRRVRASSPEMDSTGEDDPGFFYPSRELFVQGDGCSFTCLSTGVEFSGAEPYLPTGAIDYAAVTCEARPFPVLGFTQGGEGESAYPILLDALASLVELTLPLRFEALDRDVYRGLLGPAPVFDLTLVLWDNESNEDPRRPICELARDLAEIAKESLRRFPRFPPVLNDIVCLRMNDKRFDGRLRYAWRV